jgi:FkbM family methyltransferase
VLFTDAGSAPCPYEARFLLDHIRMNQLANVRVIQAAVTDRVGLVAMSTERGMTQNRIHDSADTTLIVSALTLDSLELSPPNLIKMDVEGAESEVLIGAQRTLRDVRPIVFVALHSIEQREKCTALLREAGYTIYDLKGRLVRGEPETDEIYALPEMEYGEIHT